VSNAPYPVDTWPLLQHAHSRFAVNPRRWVVDLSLHEAADRSNSGFDRSGSDGAVAWAETNRRPSAHPGLSLHAPYWDAIAITNEYLEFILEQAGYEVVSATSADEAALPAANGHDAEKRSINVKPTPMRPTITAATAQEKITRGVQPLIGRMQERFVDLATEACLG